MKIEPERIARILGVLALLFAIFATVSVPGAGHQALAQVEGRTVEQASPQAGNVPGGHLGNISDAEIWREVRRGLRGTVSIPNERAGLMIQSEGENWRAWRNGPITVGGIWGIVGVIGILALFFVIRGRIRIDTGRSGREIERFNGLERFVHWLLAVSFIVLALTGLNMLYGRHVLLPALGPEVFSTITQAGKYVHNFVSFPFMVGLVLAFVLWVRHNLPNKEDMVWLVKAGGLLAKNVHPPAHKFNAGQKLLFWLVVLGGLSLSLSGIALLFPFEFSFFSWTFSVVNVLGLGLPTDLASIQDMQLSQIWHTFVALVMIAVIIGHIYLGTIGMEGAFQAMGTGHVDENWAREHHGLWVAELKSETASERGGGTPQPAE